MITGFITWFVETLAMLGLVSCFFAMALFIFSMAVDKPWGNK